MRNWRHLFINCTPWSSVVYFSGLPGDILEQWFSASASFYPLTMRGHFDNAWGMCLLLVFRIEATDVAYNRQDSPYNKESCGPHAYSIQVEKPHCGNVCEPKLVGLQGPKPLTPNYICFYLVGVAGMNLTGNKQVCKL